MFKSFYISPSHVFNHSITVICHRIIQVKIIHICSNSLNDSVMLHLFNVNRCIRKRIDCNVPNELLNLCFQTNFTIFILPVYLAYEITKGNPITLFCMIAFQWYFVLHISTNNTFYLPIEIAVKYVFTPRYQLLRFAD